MTLRAPDALLLDRRGELWMGRYTYEGLIRWPNRLSTSVEEGVGLSGNAAYWQPCLALNDLIA